MQPHTLFESSSPIGFQQVVSLFADAKNIPVSLFSSKRADRDAMLNIKARFLTRHFLKTHNVPFYEMRGMGQEIDNGQYKIVEEPTFLTVSFPLTTLIQLCETNQQDFFIYAGPETGGKICLYSMASKLPVQTWDKVVAGESPDGYTTLSDGSSFHFAS